MSLQELQGAVMQLSKEELASFAQWFDEYRFDKRDGQIEAGALAGRLDAMAQRTITDCEAGRFTELQVLTPSFPSTTWERGRILIISQG